MGAPRTREGTGVYKVNPTQDVPVLPGVIDVLAHLSVVALKPQIGHSIGFKAPIKKHPISMGTSSVEHITPPGLMNVRVKKDVKVVVHGTRRP